MRIALSFFSHFRMMLAVSLSYIDLFCWTFFPFCMMTFIMKSCWILSKAFHACIGFYIYLSTFVWFTIFIDLYVLNQCYISGRNSNWSWVDDLLDMCLDFICYLLKIFLHPYLRRIFLCGFVFVVVLPGWDIKI